MLLLFCFFIVMSNLSTNAKNSNDSKPLTNGQHVRQWKYTAGDDTNYSKIDFDDSEWDLVSSGAFFVAESDIHWLRSEVTLPDTTGFGKKLFFHFAYLQDAYQVYWNGEMVGENGSIDTSGIIQRTGTIYHNSSIELAKPLQTVNTLAIRFALNSDSGEKMFFRSWVGYSDERPFYDVGYLVRQGVYIAISFVGVVFGLSFFLAGGSFRSYMFLSLVCLPILILKIYQFSMFYFNLSLDYFVPWYYVNILYLLSEMFIVTFFIIIFNISRKILHIGLIAAISVAQDFTVNFYDSINIWIIAVYLYSIIGYAVHKKMHGSLIALIGFTIFNIPDFFEVLGYYVFPLAYDISYSFFITSLFVVASRHVSHQIKIKHDIESRSKRLENELIKKSIQPHFIANSLATIRSLSKSAPKSAEGMIQAISNEYYLLNKMISENEIAICEEIELCREHLRVMGFRREAEYKLYANNIPCELLVPPLIFHTLIENGITHSLEPKEPGNFGIVYKRDKNVDEFTIENNGSLIYKIDEMTLTNLEEGLGYKYIRARLEENYSGNWHLNYCARNGTWQTTIRIKR